MVTKKGNVRKTEQEDSQNSNLGRFLHLEAQENPKWNDNNQDVSEQCQAGRNDVEAVVNTPGVGVSLQGKVPVGLDRQALEQRNQEDGDSLQSVEGIEDVDDHSNARLLTTESQQEQEYRSLDEGQDRVVKQLC